MSWLRNFFSRIFGRKRRGSGWRGFEAVDEIHPDTPEEFRRHNDV